MFGIWVDSTQFSHQLRNGRTMDKWKAVIDLGCAVESELGPNVSVNSTKEIRKQLKSSRPVKYVLKEDIDGRISQIQLSSDTPSKEKSSTQPPQLESVSKWKKKQTK
jgi:hypothetical protein